jgi:ATP-dependent helicase/nuclease subunit B
MSDRPTAELLLAPAAGGKTAAAVELLAASRSGRALALVPSRNQQISLYQRLGGTRGVRAVQFYQLAGIVLARAGAPPDLLGDTARIGLVRTILLDIRDTGSLPTYAVVAHKRGFVAAVAELLADLGDADIAPDAFSTAARTPHDYELAAIYARYIGFQEARGVADLPRRLRLARDALLARPGLLDSYVLLAVDGFDQFTPLQLSLLAVAARRIPRVAITLTLDERERPTQRRFARTYDKLRAALDLRVRRLDPDPGRCAAPLRHLEAHLFDLDEQLQHVPAAGAVALIEAADREREVRAVLRRVKRLVVAGTPSSQIAILYRDGAPYTALLREVAAEYGLPLDVHEGLPLDQAPPAAALLGLLRLALDDYPRRALVETLCSPYLDDRRPTTDDRPAAEDGGSKIEDGKPSIPDPRSPIPDPRSSTVGGQWSVVGGHLDAVARYKGIAGGLARWQFALAELAAAPPQEPGEDGEQPPVTPEQAAALAEALERFCAWATPPAQATVAEYIAWVYARVAGMRIDDQLFAERDQAAIERFEKLLHELARAAELLGGTALPFRAFLDDLADAAASARYRLPSAGGVAALPALAARGLAFAHVAILGLSEGEFPRPLQEPAIYRRAERRALREERGLPLPAPDPADERTIFYEAVARARQGLILGRTRLDEQGNPLPRSPYLAALLDLLDGAEIANIPAGGIPDWEEATSPEERALALSVADDRRPTTDDRRPTTDRRPPTTVDPQFDSPLYPFTPSPLHTRLQAIRAEYPVWDHIVRAQAVEAGREGMSAYGIYEGAIADAELAAEVARRFGPEHRWSVTEFNDYITCPFRFAAAHVLRLQLRRDPEEALDSGRRGQLYHAILARAGEQWRAAGLALAPEHEEAALAALDLAAQEVLDSAPELLGFAPAAFWPWERDELRRRLRAALRGFIHGAAEWQAFAPAAVERTFGGRRGDPPLRVETPAGPVLVRGRVDRIDERADGALAVVDYKSGSSARPAKDALEGRDLQLAVYILAVEQVIAAGQQVERAAFHQIGSGKRGGELKGEQLRDALQVARERIAETIAAVRAADFRVRPRDKCPDFCAFEAICRRNLEKRKQ